MKLSKLAIILGATFAFTLSSGGCSSKTDNQQPVYHGPEDPSLKRAGRGIGGEPAKPAGPASRGPATKD